VGPPLKKTTVKPWYKPPVPSAALTLLPPSHWAAALKRISPRAARVITLALLERRSPEECARFFGIGTTPFLCLLAHSLAELAQGERLTESQELLASSAGHEHLQRALQRVQSADPSPGSPLEALVSSLWRAGPAAIPPREPEGGPEPRWRIALRWALVAAVIAGLLWWSVAS